MKRAMIALAAGLGVCLVASIASAAPTNRAAVPDSLLGSEVEQARLYCYSTRTGQFLHWGPCGHDRWRYYHRYHYRHYY